MSYFAKPNFIIYDEWFNDDLEKKKSDPANKKIKTVLNIHEFFYEQSKTKVGGSENNFELEYKVNEKKLFNNNLEYISKKLNSVTNKEFLLFKKLTQSTLKFNIKKQIIFSLTISSFIFIFGFLISFISQSKKNEASISNIIFTLERVF